MDIGVLIDYEKRSLNETVDMDRTLENHTHFSFYNALLFSQKIILWRAMSSYKQQAMP
jgi:hypothetical protein